MKRSEGIYEWMGGRRRFTLLVLVLVVSALAVGGVSMTLLYRAAYREQERSLSEQAGLWAYTIEAVARFDAVNSAGDVRGGAAAATLLQVRTAYEKYTRTDRVAELAIAQLHGDHIDFYLHDMIEGATGLEESADYAQISLDSPLAVPMRRALAGESGAIVGLDYRGVEVLAAYEPVSALNMAVVAKIDLAQIRAPFVRAGLWALCVAAAVIGVGTMVLMHLGIRLFEQADEQMVKMHGDNVQLAREVQAREKVEANLKALNDTLEERVAARTNDLEQARIAALNVMEDAELQNGELRNTQRAMLSIMEDSEEARKKAEEAAAEVRHYRDHLEELVQERTATLRAVNHELEAFSYSVSHDLRAPLRSIDGFSQALIEDYEEQLDEQGKDYLGRVRAASQRMAQLIDDMLNLSRLTRGELNKAQVDLSAMAREVEQELRAGDPERRVEFVVEADMVVRGDARMLRAVLDNLLGNAWKFTVKKDGARIEFGRVAVDGERAFYVRDNGVGFDMEYVDKLFGAFQRLHTEQEFAGSGIGLATVQRIVHRHGGRA